MAGKPRHRVPFNQFELFSRLHVFNIDPRNIESVLAGKPPPPKVIKICKCVCEWKNLRINYIKGYICIYYDIKKSLKRTKIIRYRVFSRPWSGGKSGKASQEIKWKMRQEREEAYNKKIIRGNCEVFLWKEHKKTKPIELICTFPQYGTLNLTLWWIKKKIFIRRNI